jgi:nucleotide-binding universal stress UspA family protein
VFTRVLVAVENTAQAPRVLALAALLARQGSLHVPLHVTLAHATTQLLGSAKVQISADDLEYLTERLHEQGVNAHYLLKFEKPEHGIVDAAAYMRADLIALMPHGRQGLEGLLHPSVTAKLLASGTTPVLFWPDHLEENCAQDLLSLPSSKVILPLDGSQQAERALPYAIDLANAFERSLLLARVMPYPTPPMALIGGVAYMPSDLLPMEREETQIYLEEMVARCANDTIAPMKTMTLLGSPAGRILEAAHAQPCSIIVMSTHGRGALGRTLVGSVTTATVQNATTPILVIPPYASEPLVRTAPLKHATAVG